MTYWTDKKPIRWQSPTIASSNVQNIASAARHAEIYRYQHNTICQHFTTQKKWKYMYTQWYMQIYGKILLDWSCSPKRQRIATKIRRNDICEWKSTNTVDWVEKRCRVSDVKSTIELEFGVDGILCTHWPVSPGEKCKWRVLSFHVNGWRLDEIDGRTDGRRVNLPTAGFLHSNLTLALNYIVQTICLDGR